MKVVKDLALIEMMREQGCVWLHDLSSAEKARLRTRVLAKRVQVFKRRGLVFLPPTTYKLIHQQGKGKETVSDQLHKAEAIIKGQAERNSYLQRQLFFKDWLKEFDLKCCACGKVFEYDEESQEVLFHLDLSKKVYCRDCVETLSSDLQRTDIGEVVGEQLVGNEVLKRQSVTSFIDEAFVQQYPTTILE